MNHEGHFQCPAEYTGTHTHTQIQVHFKGWHSAASPPTGLGNYLYGCIDNNNDSK